MPSRFLTTAHRSRRLAMVVTSLAAVLLSACAGLGDVGLGALGGGTQETAASDDRNDLQKATDYWSKEYAKDPKSSKALLSYVRNLRALGQRAQALAVLQAAADNHGTNREYLGEYGRLALEAEQVSTALKLLEQADDPTRPDWRIINARAIALSKLARYREAIPLFERALQGAPGQASIVNNLALAYTMDGQAARAEQLLTEIAQQPNADPRIRQNLALVLGMQGKHIQARAQLAQDLAPDQADANVAYMRQMVKANAQEIQPSDVNGAVPAVQWVADPGPAAVPAPARPRTATPRPAKAAPTPAPKQATAPQAGIPALRPAAD